MTRAQNDRAQVAYSHNCEGGLQMTTVLGTNLPLEGRNMPGFSAPNHLQVAFNSGPRTGVAVCKPPQSNSRDSQEGNAWNG